MYSVVLLMAMSGAPDTAATFCHRNHGCQGQVASSGCYGGGAACYGGGAACYGGGAACHGGHGGLFHKHAHGGAGGCQGYVAASSCGCGTAMPVGCYGGGYGGGMGCYGGGYGGGMGCYGGGMPGGYTVPMGTAPATGGTPATAPKMPATGGTTPPVAGGGLPLAYSAAPATLVVNLPEDANLKIDGMATKATAGTRQFTTPVLAQGQSYYYTLSAEIVRDGKTFAATQTVTVRAGLTSQVEIPAASFGMAVASK